MRFCSCKVAQLHIYVYLCQCFHKGVATTSWTLRRYHINAHLIIRYCRMRFGIGNLYCAILQLCICITTQIQKRAVVRFCTHILLRSHCYNIVRPCGCVTTIHIHEITLVQPQNHTAAVLCVSTTAHLCTRTNANLHVYAAAQLQNRTEAWTRNMDVIYIHR